MRDVIKEEIPLLYLYIYRRIRIKANGRRVISYEGLREVLKRNLHNIPLWGNGNIFYYNLIKELEGFNLIRQINKITFELIGGEKDKILNKYNCIV